MRILDSALKHGFSSEEIEHVINCCPFRLLFDSSFGKCYVYWGPDKNGNMMEVFMDTEDDVVFHAMKLSKTIESLIIKRSKK